MAEDGGRQWPPALLEAQSSGVCRWPRGSRVSDAGSLPLADRKFTGKNFSFLQEFAPTCAPDAAAALLIDTAVRPWSRSFGSGHGEPSQADWLGGGRSERNESTVKRWGVPS